MGTIDSSSLHCSAQGCVYAADPSALGLFCGAHWELVPKRLRDLLRHEDEAYGPERTGRWLHLCIAAVQAVANEETDRRLRDDPEARDWLPKRTELEALA